MKSSGSDPLPYVQVDRAAKPKAALLAGAMGVTIQHAIGSLVEWWDLCGDPRTLELIALRTEPGSDPAVILDSAEAELRFRLASGHTVSPSVLTHLGLLEDLGEGRYRVRGMSRYFSPILSRIQARKAASLGGKASVESRRKSKGTTQPARSEVASKCAQADPEALVEARVEADSEAPPKRARSVAEASPNPSVHRSDLIPSSSKTGADEKEFDTHGQISILEAPVAQRRTKRSKTESATDPRHSQLVRAFTAAGLAFDGGRDAKQVQRLLALASQQVGVEGAVEEVLGRWRRALAHEGFPRVRTLTELADRWGHFEPTQEERSASSLPSCAACGAPAPTGWPDLGVATCHAHAAEAAQWADEHGVKVYEQGGADVWLAEFWRRQW